jgi:hypothetical protein
VDVLHGPPASGLADSLGPTRPKKPSPPIAPELAAVSKSLFGTVTGTSSAGQPVASAATVATAIIIRFTASGRGIVNFDFWIVLIKVGYEWENSGGSLDSIPGKAPWILYNQIRARGMFLNLFMEIIEDSFPFANLISCGNHRKERA